VQGSPHVVESRRIAPHHVVTPAKAGVQKRLENLDSAPVFQRGKLKIDGMTARRSGAGSLLNSPALPVTLSDRAGAWLAPTS